MHADGAHALDRWLERLWAAENLVQVSRVLFDLAEPRGFGLELLDDAGSPLVTIGGVGALFTGWARDTARFDPVIDAVRKTHTVLAFTDVVPAAPPDPGALAFPVDKILVGPICSRGRVVGTARFIAAGPVDPATRAIAQAACTHVAVRLAELGFEGAGPVRLGRLTPRQREVARLIASGSSTTEIGEALGVSPNTVKKHLKSIFHVLDLVNRAELAAIVSRFGASITELDDAHEGLHIAWVA